MATSGLAHAAAFGAPAIHPPNWVRARRSTLDPAHREGRSREVDLIPSKVSQFARPEPVAIRHRDHGGVTVPQRLPLAASASAATSASVRCRTSFREATDGRESDMIYVICVAGLVRAPY